jgi:hypothetical protein
MMSKKENNACTKSNREGWSDASQQRKLEAIAVSKKLLPSAIAFVISLYPLAAWF